MNLEMGDGGIEVRLGVLTVLVAELRIERRFEEMLDSNVKGPDTEEGVDERGDEEEEAAVDEDDEEDN